MLNQRPITLWPTSHLWREFPANKVYHLSPKCLGTDDGTVSHIRLQIISFDELYTSPSKFCSWRPCVCVLKSLCLALQNITFNSTIQHGTCTHVFWSQKNAHKCRLRIKFDVFVCACTRIWTKANVEFQILSTVHGTCVRFDHALSPGHRQKVCECESL